MPKNLGIETTSYKRVRSIDNFTVSIHTSGDVVDVAPVIENRDPDTDALLSVTPMDPMRFSQTEVEAIVSTIPELGGINYETLRTGVSKLIHALIDTQL